MNRFEWADAPDVDTAIALIKERDGAAVKAGGVDLLDLMKEGIAQPPRLVNIRNIKALKFLQQDDQGLRIGPLTTMAELADDPTVLKVAPALAQAAAAAATPQIRNMATVGGNLLQRPRCWYFRSEQFHCRRKGGPHCFAIDDGENQYHAIFDNKKCAIVHPSGAAIPLVAMGAEIELVGSGVKRRAKLEEFFVTPEEDILRENRRADDEILTEIRIPKLPANARTYYLKQGEKESFDWPIADCAAVLVMDGQTCKSASVVLGAAAPTPHRAKEAEQLLVGKTIDEKSAREAAKAALADAQPLSQNAYKLPVFEAIITRTILGAAKA